MTCPMEVNKNKKRKKKRSEVSTVVFLTRRKTTKLHGGTNLICDWGFRRWNEEFERRYKNTPLEQKKTLKKK